MEILSQHLDQVISIPEYSESLKNIFVYLNFRGVWIYYNAVHRFSINHWGILLLFFFPSFCSLWMFWVLLLVFPFLWTFCLHFQVIIYATWCSWKIGEISSMCLPKTHILEVNLVSRSKKEEEVNLVLQAERKNKKIILWFRFGGGVLFLFLEYLFVHLLCLRAMSYFDVNILVFLFMFLLLWLAFELLLHLALSI